MLYCAPEEYHQFTTEWPIIWLVYHYVYHDFTTRLPRVYHNFTTIHHYCTTGLPGKTTGYGKNHFTRTPGNFGRRQPTKKWFKPPNFWSGLIFPTEKWSVKPSARNPQIQPSFFYFCLGSMQEAQTFTIKGLCMRTVFSLTSGFDNEVRSCRLRMPMLHVTRNMSSK